MKHRLGVLLLCLLLSAHASAWEEGPLVHRAEGLLVGVDPLSPLHMVVVALGSEPATVPAREGCRIPELREVEGAGEGELRFDFEHRCPRDRTERLDSWPVRACAASRMLPTRVRKLVLRAESNSLVVNVVPTVPGSALHVFSGIDGKPGHRTLSYAEMVRLAGTPGRRAPGWPNCFGTVATLVGEIVAEREAAAAAASAATTATTATP